MVWNRTDPEAAHGWQAGGGYLQENAIVDVDLPFNNHDTVFEEMIESGKEYSIPVDCQVERDCPVSNS